MSIDTQAAVIVGLTYNEFTTLKDGTEDYDDGYTINGKEIYDFDEIGFVRISPYYDAPDDNCAYGFLVEESEQYGFTEFNIDDNRVNELKVEFKKLTGLEGKLLLGAYVW